MGVKELLKKFPIVYAHMSEINYFIQYYKNRRLAKKSSELIVRKVYYSAFRKEPDLVNPQTFNEKLNWMKLYWYDNNAAICSDKYLVREYVESKGLGFLLNELYAVYDDPDDISLDDLPKRFVLKATHDSGHVICCYDKREFNLNSAKRKLKRWLIVDYEYISGEWAYATRHKRVVCEKYLEDINNSELLDYKFFCFNGKPEIIFFCSDRTNHVKSDFYDTEWNLLPFRWIYEPSGKVFPRPKNLNKMIEYARILSEGFPFVRADFYNIDGIIYFGELTFFHGGGVGWFDPEIVDKQLGDRIILPPKNTSWKFIRQSNFKNNDA